MTDERYTTLALSMQGEQLDPPSAQHVARRTAHHIYGQHRYHIASAPAQSLELTEKTYTKSTITIGDGARTTSAEGLYSSHVETCGCRAESNTTQGREAANMLYNTTCLQGVESSDPGTPPGSQELRPCYDSPSAMPYNLKYGSQPALRRAVRMTAEDGGGVFTYTATSDPSLISEDTSLGDPSHSHSTTAYDRRVIDTKQRVDFSSPSRWPSTKASQIICNFHAGVSPNNEAVRRELLGAGVKELVDMLLELSDINIEAAHFIKERACDIAKRRYSHGNTVSDPRDGYSLSMGPDVSQEMRGTRRCEGGVFVGRCATHSQVAQGKSPFPLEEAVNGGRGRSAASESAIDSTISSRVLQHDQTFGQISTSFSSNCGVGGCELGEEADRPVETQSFCLEKHPCLQSYGGCKRPSSCVFTTCPRNLCLNWVRGSCSSESKCGGVHRLPGHCLSEVRTVRKFNHGTDIGEPDRRGTERNDRQQHSFPHDAQLNGVGPANRGMDGFEETSALTVEESSVKLTPRDQIISNPVSVPASLERLVREVPPGENEHNNIQERALLRHCRGYRSWLRDGCVEDQSERWCQEVGSGQLLSPVTPGGKSVVRSLSCDFAAAVDSSLDTLVVVDGCSRVSPLIQSVRGNLTLDSADSGGVIPSFTSHPRSSPPL